MTERRWFWIAIVLVLAATAALRIHLLQTPLERDEGEYAYAGQLMLRGVPPYLDAANMKLPGTYAAYALLMAIFGQTITGVHLGLLVVNAVAIVLVALVGARLFGAPSGVAAAAAYALMSMGYSVYGTQAHATHFVVAAALGGLWLLLRYEDAPSSRTLIGSGLLFGLAFLMKQHGVFFCLCGWLWLCWTEWRRRRVLPVAAPIIFGAAMLAPFVLTCLLLWRAGVFTKFWFWTFTYARQYAAELSVSDGLAMLGYSLPRILTDNAALWMLALAGLTLLWVKRDKIRSAALVSLFAIFSVLSVCPGFYFRGHYFVMLLPAVALLAGATVRGRISAGIFAVALLISGFVQREFLFELGPTEASLQLYGPNLFIEAIPVASYIREHSGSNSRIAVLGSEPEIYFYSGRVSATSYIYTYAMMEDQRYAATMQGEMIQEIAENAPEFVVMVTTPTSWLLGPDSLTRIFDWWNQYGAEHYTRVGLVVRTADGEAIYRWGTDAARTPLSPNCYAIYRRR